MAYVFPLEFDIVTVIIKFLHGFSDLLIQNMPMER